MAKIKGSNPGTGLPTPETEELADGTEFDKNTGEVEPRQSMALAATDRNTQAMQKAIHVGQDGTVKELAIASDDEIVQDAELDDLTQYAQGFGYTKEEIKVLCGGMMPFWPCVPGLILSGVIESRRTQKSSIRDKAGVQQDMAGYVLRVTNAPTISSTTDMFEQGKVKWLQPGERIFVIERSLMRDFADRVGKEVFIKCIGRKPSRNNPAFKYWDFRILEVGAEPSPAERSAQALGSMAQEQRRLAAQNG